MLKLASGDISKATTGNFFNFRKINLKFFLSAFSFAFWRIHGIASNIERFLILFAALVAIWFVGFDVYPPSNLLGAFAIKGLLWCGILALGVIVHLISLYLNSQKWRKGVCLYHSLVWMVLTFIASTAEVPAMSTPLVFGLFVMGFYEAARMRLKEHE